ncbi:MAG: Na/Pi cotransporter family protein [Planctomycetota bacterium]|nr:MAG: Na/Pi cotransporter family protein [Planctomycetota bacterium]
MNVVMILGLLGGLAVFLLGLELLTENIKRAAGAALRGLIRRSTRTPLRGVATGFASTAVLQSSSITSVLIVGFVSAGILSLKQSVGVIMGANIGCTIMPQLIAFNIAQYALAAVALGYGMRRFSSRRRLRQWGNVILGMGLVFVGLGMLSATMAPLREVESFTLFLQSLDNQYLLALLIGLVFTAVVNSSAATLGILLVLLQQNMMPLPTAVAMVIGANIGTCITALLASMGQSRIALRAAMVHLLFNCIGAILAFPFIVMMSEWALWITPDNTGRALVNAHTGVNIIWTLLMLPAAGALAQATVWLVPDRRSDSRARPKHLDRTLLSYPDAALDATYRDLVRMGNIVERMTGRMYGLFNGDERLAREQAVDEGIVDRFHLAVLEYLGALDPQSLDEEQLKRLNDLIALSNALEMAADELSDPSIRVCEKLNDGNYRFQRTVRHQLRASIATLVEAQESIFNGLRNGDPDAARRGRSQRKLVKQQLNQLSNDADQHLTSNPDQLAPLYRLEAQVVNILRAHHACMRRAAKLVVRQRVYTPAEPSRAPEAGDSTPDPAEDEAAGSDTTRFYFRSDS